MKVSQQHYLQYAEHVGIELEQASDEGKAVGPEVIEKAQRIMAMPAGDPEKEKRAALFLDEMERLPSRPDYPYTEPSDWEGIRQARPADAPDRPFPVKEDALADKIYGAWLARCAGCLFGQPVEGWKRDRITGFLRDTGNLPVVGYMSSDIDQALIDQYGIVNDGGPYGNEKVSWINNVRHMVEDDDTNYTILGLFIVEKHGADFTPDDVATAWLRSLPIHSTCTAERIAYRNMVNLLDPPRSATFRNAYREWIGAQIRADSFGYVNPGHPAKAAEMAWRDASISHVKNGIYGEMWVAAMLAAAAVTDDIDEIVEQGLKQIPERCRLAEAIRQVVEWRRGGVSGAEAIDRIHERYDESNIHHWCHTISNAMIVTSALLYGSGDLSKTFELAITAGFDTDCNCATAGSVLGMRSGARSLPAAWIEPLRDKIRSGVNGIGTVSISRLAERTVQCARNNPYLILN